MMLQESHRTAPARYLLPPVCLLLTGLWLLSSGGCGHGHNDQIVAYAVPKPHVVYEQNHAPPPDRTLGGILLQEQTGWFFKLSGPSKSVAQQVEAFRELIESVRFSADANPSLQWTNPSGWKQQTGSGIRLATLVITTVEPPLEVSVTPLPITLPSHERYLIENVNRWRNELGLQPITNEQLPDQSETIPLEGTTALIVNMVGRRRAGGMQGNMQPPKAVPSSPRSPPEAPTSNLTYDVPVGWSPGQTLVSRGGISVRFEAAFEVVTDNARLDITVSRFPAAMARPLQNVNRWRQQLGLSGMSQVELNNAFQSISVAGSPAQQIEIHTNEDAADPETILGVLAEHDGFVYFFKLKGNRDLAEKERTHFDEFVASLRWDKPDR
ncbi:MAG: hypothetical protein MK179_12075 [Pirellulaceae bacterium]|nr:hypothetical protein [Pirellulaceae bacterium]